MPALLLNVVLKAVAVGCTLLFVLAVVLMLLTWRKAKKVRPWAIVLGQAAALISVLVYWFLMRQPIPFLYSTLLVTLGLIGGCAYGAFVRVASVEGRKVMSYTLPYLCTWAALMVLTQWLTLATDRVPVVVFGLSLLNLGLNLGLNFTILVRYFTSFSPCSQSCSNSASS